MSTLLNPPVTDTHVAELALFAESCFRREAAGYAPRLEELTQRPPSPEFSGKSSPSGWLEASPAGFTLKDREHSALLCWTPQRAFAAALEIRGADPRAAWERDLAYARAIQAQWASMFAGQLRQLETPPHNHYDRSSLQRSAEGYGRSYEAMTARIAVLQAEGPLAAATLF